MVDLYEGDTEQAGGGSGICRHEVDSVLGPMVLIHWRLARADVTSLSLEGGPTLRLAGFVDPPGRGSGAEAFFWLGFYFEKLIALGGMPTLIAFVLQVCKQANAEGQREAQARMRHALGLE